MKKLKEWENWKLPENIADLIYFTKHPPDIEVPPKELQGWPAHFRISRENIENPSDEVNHLSQLGMAFKNTNNPIYTFEAFSVAHKKGIYPPMWVLNFMSEVISDWISLGGTKSLDELFEINTCQGQAPLYKKDKEERRDEMLCLDVFVLNTFFNFTIEEACNMTARRLEENPDWNKTGHKLKEISEETIKDRYKRKWKKIIRTLCENGVIEFPDMDSKEGKINYLKQFPEDAFPMKKKLEIIIKKIVV
ncbi:MAG: hypothetical protein OEV42_04380 [Deltaproteobacteria bacterium]|nr:hypothetical protein [Deltaproteobacteria bacterium]